MIVEGITESFPRPFKSTRETGCQARAENHNGPSRFDKPKFNRAPDSSIESEDEPKSSHSGCKKKRCFKEKKKRRRILIIDSDEDDHDEDKRIQVKRRSRRRVKSSDDDAWSHESQRKRIVKSSQSRRNAKPSRSRENTKQE